MDDVSTKKDSAPVKKDIVIFGKKISEVVCFRNSFIFGICAGVAGGLVTFMMTSKAAVSSHAAMASLWIGVFLYWIPCRIHYERNSLIGEYLKSQQKKLIQELREKPTSEETDSDPSSEEAFSAKLDENT